MIADQTIGTAPNSRMIATPGVTKAQPANCSERRHPAAAPPGPRRDARAGPAPGASGGG